MSIFEEPVNRLDGSPSSLGEHHQRATLIVNVASQCGLTPQYEGLQALHAQYEAAGLTVVGFPCNQFGAQEPGGSEEIATFCSTNFSVTFPMFEKIEVNGEGRHPIYSELRESSDADGYSGDVRWNFEKFLVSGDGRVQRFAPTVTPDDPQLIAAIEAALA